jgi:arabinosyltransferase A/arabinosyltransferase B/arabinosyltransferase C
MRSHNPAQERASRYRWPALGLAVLSFLASLAFVVAPVEQPEAVYSWPGASGDASPVAIPLMLFQPAELDATGACADVRGQEPRTVLLSTTPVVEIPGEPRLDGLRVTVGPDDSLQIRSGGTELEEYSLPASGECTWAVRSTPTGTTLTVDGERVREVSGDVRPAVAGVFTDRTTPGDLRVDVTADTVFQTSASPLKIAFAVLAVLALVATLVLLGLGDRARRAEGRPGSPVAPARPRSPAPLRWLIDAAVVAGLAVWTLIGPLTVDDGYISGIIRGRGDNDYIGNVYRWFNAPEAPFGWLYEVMYLWSQVSGSTGWMRVPSALLGVATWFLFSRGLLPRLGSFGRTSWGFLAAAAVFGAWWLPTNLGLRPEAWVAAGLAAVLVLLERGLRLERMLPIAGAAVVAGATLAVTPTGAAAFVPFLAAVVPLLRLARRTIGLPAATAVAVAGAGSALLLMFADQSLAAVLRANEIRAVLPGAVPWSSESDRWDQLLSAGEMQGSLARRVPVLLTLAAVAGIVWHLAARRWTDGTTRGLATRLATSFGLSLAVLLFTPTKWTMHFGALAPLGAALIVLACGLFARPPRDGDSSEPDDDDAAPARGRVGVGELARSSVALVAVFMVAALSYSGWNQWAYLSDNAIPWRDLPPQLFGITFSAVFLTGAGVVAVLGTVLVVRARVMDESDIRVPAVRWLPTASFVAVSLAALTVALQLGSFAKSSYSQRDTYSLASDVAATASGQPCGLAEAMTVETDPTAGLLPRTDATTEEEPDPVLDNFVPVTNGETPVGPALSSAGVGLPGWIATAHTSADGRRPATLVTGWYELPEGFASGGMPLVVTTAGGWGVGSGIVAEFGTVAGDRVTPEAARGIPKPGGTATGAQDARLDPATTPGGADVVRLIASDNAADTDLPLAVSAPRVPVTEQFQDVVDPDSPAIVDWPVAFVFPCQRPSVQENGITDVPEWRIASAGDGGDIIVADFVGGPYAPARTLVDQVVVPVYTDGRPMDRPIRLLRWVPRVDVGAPETAIEDRSVAAWQG